MVTFWKNRGGQDREHISKDMEAEDFLREGLELLGVRVTTMAPLLLKFRRAEATILNFSRGEGQRSWSPSTLPSGRGRPWAITTPSPLPHESRVRVTTMATFPC